MPKDTKEDFDDVAGPVSLTAPRRSLVRPPARAPDPFVTPAIERDLADVERLAEPLGKHTITVLDHRLVVLRYRGVVDELDVRALGARVRALGPARSRAVITEASGLTRFDAASRRALSEERFPNSAGSELLLAAAGASPERRATLTVVLSMLKLTTNALVEGFHTPDLAVSLERARRWLDARPA